MKVPKNIDFSNNNKRKVFDKNTPEYKSLKKIKDEGDFKLYQNQQLAKGSSVGYNISEDIFFTQPNTFEKNTIKEFSIPKKENKQLLQDDEDLDDEDLDIEIGNEDLDNLMDNEDDLENEDNEIFDNNLDNQEIVEPINNNKMEVVSIDDLRKILSEILPQNDMNNSTDSIVNQTSKGPLKGGKEALKKTYFQGSDNEVLDSEFEELYQNLKNLESHIDNEKPYVDIIGAKPKKGIPQPQLAPLENNEDEDYSMDYNNPSGCFDYSMQNPEVKDSIFSDIDKLRSNAPDESFNGNEVPKGANRLIADLPNSDDFDANEEDIEDYSLDNEYNHDEDTELLLDDDKEIIDGENEDVSGMMESPIGDFKNPDLDRFGVGEMDYSPNNEEEISYDSSEFEPDYEEEIEPAISMNKKVNINGQPIHIILTGVIIGMPEINHISESVKKAGNKLTKIEGKNNELKIIVETNTKRYTINYIDQPKNKTKTPFSINNIKFQSLDEALERINYNTEKKENHVFNTIITKDILSNEVSGPKKSNIFEGFEKDMKNNVSGWNIMPVGVVNLKTGLNETFSRITQAGNEPNTLMLTESGVYYLIKGNLKERSKIGTKKELVYLKENKNYGIAQVVGIYENNASGLGKIMYKIKRTSVPLLVWK